MITIVQYSIDIIYGKYLKFFCGEIMAHFQKYFGENFMANIYKFFFGKK